MVLTHFRQERGNFIPLPPHKLPQGELLGSRPRLGLVGLRASAYSFIWEETLAQVFSCKFCEMFENTFFIEQLRWLLLCLVFFFFGPQAPLFFTALFTLAMPGPCGWWGRVYAAYIRVGEGGYPLVCFILGGHRSWCSVRCVCTPGIRGGLRILSVTFSNLTVFLYVLRAVVLSVWAARVRFWVIFVWTVWGGIVRGLVGWFWSETMAMVASIVILNCQIWNIKVA